MMRQRTIITENHLFTLILVLDIHFNKFTYMKKISYIIGNNGMENGMKPEETVQKYVTLEEYSDSYK